jgi:GNAT superfamily N-acetyltransferase
MTCARRLVVMLPRMNTNWDDDALLAEVLGPPRRSYFPMPDLRSVERPGWMQLITPSFTNGGFNEVSLAVLGDDEADEIIDRTIAEYRSLGIRFRWSVGPECRPLDLAKRLAKRGLSSTTARGMAHILTTGTASELPAFNRDIPDVRVVEINDRSLDVFTDVMARGFSVAPAQLARANEYLFAQEDRRHRLFLGYRNGEPAAVASYVAFPRSAFLLGAVVLPAHRKCGLYRALVHARMIDAAARGITLATTHAHEETSAPLLEKMGFRTVCRYSVFHG